MARQSFKQYAQFPINEFLPILQDSFKVGCQKLSLSGFEVNCTSLRLRLFAFNKCKCVRCNAVASEFILETTDSNAVTPHLNLYGKRKDGSLLLFTKDHILPRALSGQDKMYNLQVMCEDCNHQKAHRIQLRDSLAIIRQLFRKETSLKGIIDGIKVVKQQQ